MKAVPQKHNLFKFNFLLKRMIQISDLSDIPKYITNLSTYFYYLYEGPTNHQ